MNFLRFLEGLRFEPLNTIMALITYAGDELVFMVMALVIFWCVDKRRAYYIFTTGFFGIGSSQFLKLLFRIPRPWVIDPDFTIVEAARAAACDYSFPSGHSVTAVGTFGSIRLTTEKKWVKVATTIFMVLVPFSRMYLGVHTPKDVIVGSLISLVLLAVLYPIFNGKRDFNIYIPYIFILLAILTAAYTLFVLTYDFPSDIDEDNLASGIKGAYTMIGCIIGLIATYYFDKKRDFSVEAPLKGQILKLTIGFAILVAIKAGLKAPLTALLGYYLGSCVRYIIMVLFAGIIWPLTFPYFAKIGKITEKS